MPILYKLKGKSIKSFTLPADANKELAFNIVGVVGGGTIELTMPYLPDMTGLVPDIKFEGKTIEPASGTPADFSKVPVTYTVISYDKTRKDYVVQINIMGNTDKDILSFCFTADNNPGNITGTRCGVIICPVLEPWNPYNDFLSNEEI